MRLDRSVRAALALALAVTLAGCGKNLAPKVIPPLSRIVITPATDTLAVGAQAQFTITAYDTLNQVVPGVGATWSTSDATVFTVTSAGLVVGRGEGVAELSASAGGRFSTAPVAVFVQPGWYAQPSGTINNLNGVWAAPDGLNAWAVGDAGTIVHTSDAGAHWSAQVSVTSFNLNAVWFTSPSVGWAVGNNGTVLSTATAGQTWTRLTNVPSADNLTHVTFTDATHGWAVGSNGAILHTSNGGTTWTKHAPTAFQLERVAFSDTSNGWAVGQGGVIVGTHDGGASWYIVQPAVTGAALYGAWRSSNQTAFAAGANGAFAFTTANVDSFAWNLGSLGGSNQIQSLQLVDASVGYAVGDNGTGLVLKTENGGAVWSTQVSNSAQKLRDVWFVDELRGWAVGQGGRILHTARGGL